MGVFDFFFRKKKKVVIVSSPQKAAPVSNSTNSSSTSRKGQLIYQKLNDYTVIDLETSSKYANQASIIELAAVKVRKGRIVQQYSTLIKPPEPISDAVSNLTGITNEMLVSAPPLDQKFAEYLQFLGNDVLLGHNIWSYDINVLNYACDLLHHAPIKNNVLDTMHYARNCEIAVINYRLPTLARYFNIAYDAHRALNDCIANHYVYEGLKTKYNGVFHTPIDRTKQSKKNMLCCKINPRYSDIKGKSIVLTGEFEIAEVEDIEKKLESLGALIKKSVSGKTDYLIIGNLGHRQWAYGSYGTKIKRALELQEQGKPLIMVEEDLFFDYKK